MNLYFQISFFWWGISFFISSKVTYASEINENYMCGANTKCILKCCDFDRHVTVKVSSTKLICSNDYEIPIDVDKQFDKVFVDKPDLPGFEIKPKAFFLNKTLRTSSIDITREDLGLDFNIYLTENAEVMLETPNEYDRWTRVPNDMYCLDLKEEQKDGEIVMKPGIWIIYQDNQKADRPVTTVMSVGMLISCVFLVLVLIVYWMLPELRNLFGKILIAYVASLLFAFLLLACMRFGGIDALGCEILSYLVYYFFMASFCWMNVMSYDIWWTFRGYAKARQIHRRGESFKFQMYCFYAFGLPLAMTIMLAVLNHLDLRHVPWFVTPKIARKSCFFAGGEQLLYMYIPILILNLSNWVLFLMTALNIWRLSRGTAVLDKAAAGTPHAHRTNYRRFIIYLKLSIVMGLNWILEVVSCSSSDSVVWYISDFYNIFIGVAIFIIFVCKRKILSKIKSRLSKGQGTKWYPNQEESSKVATSTCDSSTVTKEQQSVPMLYSNVNECKK